MNPASAASDPVAAWLADLDERHLADLTPSEVARALRSLSSIYVERRARLSEGAALDGAGKRAAFALFYAPLHFFTIARIVETLPGAGVPLDRLLDLGCGTGVAGAAWALHARAGRIDGIDRHAWAAAEATRTYRSLGLQGRATTGDLLRARLPRGGRAGIVAAYAVNEVSDAGREQLLTSLIDAHGEGAAVLVVEPIARRALAWWPAWAAAFVGAGGRADEWRFPAVLPDRQRALAAAAGLDPRELTARTLFVAGRA